ncbi:P-loop containing nucleoside triphosphate hydrolase protein [Trametes punicea]|nr:P-loop containing nucleoside triphosphate hydrolase protein [Trametes punicea]
MAAPLWSRSASLFPAARICRCSQGSLAARALRAACFPLVRYASAAALKDQELRQVPQVPMESLKPVRPLDAEANIKQASPETEELPKFNTLEGSISRSLLHAIIREPFKLTTMSSVQAAVLPRVQSLARRYDPEDSSTEPRDLLVKARTGTGKTLAFLIPAVEARLQRLRERAEQVAQETNTANKIMIQRAVERFARENIGALIISPTRELATQIANEAIKLTRHLDRFEVRLAVGGLPKRPQLREFNMQRRDIVVATPGRLRDFIENEPGFKEALQTTDIFILDEADTLLEMGFREDIQAIADELKPSPERQTFMFSATVSRPIQQVARSLLSKNHEFINCVPDDAPPTHASIPQYYTAVPSPKDQLPHLLRLIAEDQLANPNRSKVLVFLPTTSMVSLYTSIIKDVAHLVLPAGRDTSIGELHSKKAMSTRIKISDWFRSRKIGSNVLITSDVSARGVDYPNVTRVIQVGAPSSGDTYVHRVGRTGRGSNTNGRADLILMPWELGFLTWQLTDIPIKELPTNHLKEQVLDLARKYDENPEAFTTGRSAPFKGNLAERLEKIEELSTSGIDPPPLAEDVRDALISLLAFYKANYAQLRANVSVAVHGVHEWAAALLGQEIDLRIPADLRKGGEWERGSQRQKNRYSYKRDDSGQSRGFGDRGRDNDRSFGGYGRDNDRSFGGRGRDNDRGFRSYDRRDEERDYGRRDYDREPRRRDYGRDFSRRDGERDSDRGDGERNFEHAEGERDSEDRSGDYRPRPRKPSQPHWVGRGTVKARRPRRDDY